MAAQKGRDLLIKIADETGAFVTVAGLRTKSLSLDAKLVDITHSDSVSAWRELLPGAGVKKIEVSGNGIFRDAATDAIARTAFFNQSPQSCQIIIPNFGQIEGAFLISQLRYSGAYSGEAQYEITLASAGAITFSAV